MTADRQPKGWLGGRFHRLMTFLRHLTSAYTLAEQAVQVVTEESKPSTEPCGATLVLVGRVGGEELEDWIHCLEPAARKPDELIYLAPAGTCVPETVEEALAVELGCPVRVREWTSKNLVRVRNRAVQDAAHDLVVFTETDCRPGRDWLGKLLAPLRDGTVAFHVGSVSVSAHSRPAAAAYRHYPFQGQARGLLSTLAYIKNIGFRKAAWARAGGFSEVIPPQASAALFSQRMLALKEHYVVSSRVEVDWCPPDSMGELAREFYQRGKEEGMVGLYPPTRADWIAVLLLAAGLVSVLLALCFSLVKRQSFPFWGVVFMLSLGAGLFRVGWVLLKSAAGGDKTSWKEDLARSWAKRIRMLGYLTGVRFRKETQQQLAEEGEIKLLEIAAAHPNRRGIVVYFPTHDWGFMFQRPQQIARQFAALGYLFFYCTRNEDQDAVADFQEVEPNLVLSSVPPETFRILSDLILYLGSAWYAPYLDWFQGSRVIYDHYDDLEMSSARREDHQRLLAEADLVIASSKKLLSSVQTTRKDALFLPNAVDYPLVQVHKPQPGDPVPGELAAARDGYEGMIGFVGALAEWVDYNLLSFTAESHPEWSLVLIGSNYDESIEGSQILTQENIFWLGWQPYPDLFNLLWHFDVTIIPFKVNKMTRAFSPVKLFEYFACQKPIVSTPLPECRQYPEVLVGETKQEFIEQIKKAFVLLNSETYLMRLDQLAQENTWAARVREIDRAIENDWKT